MKNFKKMLAGILCAISVCSLALTGVGCGGAKAPDYSESEADFTYWAYSATYDGWWQTYYPDDPNRQVRLTNSEETPIAITDKDSLREYKECGFNTLFINYVFSFSSTSFNDTNNERAVRVKQIMDWCQELGLKCFLFDGTLHSLSATEGSLLDPNNTKAATKFESQEALNAWMADYMKDVMEHPAFIGYSLNDEPPYSKLTAWGEVYKAIKSVKPDAFVQLNLLPVADGTVKKYYCENATNMGLLEAYKEYLRLYLDATGADFVMYDSYPFTGGKDTPTLDPEYFVNMQIVADFCKENNLDFRHVFQSCAWDVGFGNTTPSGRRCYSKADMYWQLNTGMAFGVDGYAYWNYYPCVNTNGEHHDLESSFLDRAGNQNDIYKWVKSIHSEMKNTAKALANFDYQASTIVTKTPIPGIKSHIAGMEKQEMSKINTPVLESNGILLVTELYDEATGQIGYYFVNATDTLKKAEMEFSVQFTGKYGNVQTYYKGMMETEKIKNKTFSYSLGAGEGIFVLPY